MFLKRVCLFLVLAFLVVDVFLLTVYLQARNDFLVLSEEMIENTIQYYENNGVSIKEGAIQAVIPENPVYTFDATNTECAPEIVESLAEDMFSETVSVGFAETPDGISYSLSDTGSVIAVFRVYNDSFRFEYTSDSFTKDDVSFLAAGDIESDNRELPSVIRKQTDSFIKCVSSGSDTEYVLKNAYTSGDGTYVYINQAVYHSNQINEMYMNLYFCKEKLVYAEGNWIFGSIKKSYKEQLTDGVNALNKIDISTISEVLSENVIYMYRNSGRGRYYLIPTWKIEYIDINGSLKTQYIDAIKS